MCIVDKMVLKNRIGGCICMKRLLSCLTAAILIGTMSVAVMPDAAISVSASQGIVTDSLSKNGISINANHFTYFYLDDSYDDVLTIPDELIGDNQIKVTGYRFPEFRIMSGDALCLDSYGNFEQAVYDFGETKSGTSIVDVVCGDVTFEVTVDVINYADYYVQQTVDNYITEHITDTMTTYEKVEEACKFVASYDYGACASMHGMVLYGYGDCWAATDAICYFCKKLGIPAISHHEPNSLSSTHYNAMVQIDGVNYIAEAGYVGTAPRSYNLSKRELYTELSDGTICLNSYPDWNAEQVDIPATYEGKTVAKIGDEAFMNCKNLKQVTIPDTIQEIGEKAFSNSGLTTVEIPASVKTIGEQAFSECDSLKSVIMNSDAECGYSVFYSCDSLTDFVFPKTMQKLNLGFFADCYAYKNIVLPDSLTYIDSQAFRSYHTNTRNLYIPPSVTGIHEDAFYDTTTGLTIYGKAGSYAETFASENSISFQAVSDASEMPFVPSEEELAPTNGSCGDEVNWYLDTETGILTISGSGKMTDFESYSDQPWAKRRSQIKKAVIEPGVTHLGDYAFMYCGYMTEIELSEGLVSMGEDVFWDTAIPEMKLPESLEYIGFDTYGCARIQHLEIPGTTGLYGYTFMSCDNMFHVTLGDGIKSVPYCMFINCSNLSWVDIPDSVDWISYSVFSGCKSLSNIHFPQNLKSIGETAFIECENLKYVVIPKSVEYIGTAALGYKSYNSDTNSGTLYDDFIIYGYQGTEAETYAKENNIPFIALEDVRGDVNQDGDFTIADVVLLQKWLLDVPETQLVDWKSGDLYNDNVLNVLDLCLMKRELMK